jgi:hypothetical protein
VDNYNWSTLAKLQPMGQKMAMPPCIKKKRKKVKAALFMLQKLKVDIIIESNVNSRKALYYLVLEENI